MYRIKSSLEYPDPVFDIGLTTAYEISIQASPDGFSFCIANPINYHILFIKEYCFVEKLAIDDIAQLFNEINYWDDLLRLPYKSTKLMYSSQQVTLVPDSLFSAQKAQELLNSLYMPSAYSENVVVNHIKTLDIWSVSSIPTPIYSALNNHQPTATIYNSIVPICERMVTESFTGGQTQIIVNKNGTWIDLFITENGRLTLHNQYNYLNHTDMCYFVANAVDQLSIDADKLIIRLIGDIDQHSEEIPLLRKYFPNVVLEKNHSLFHGKVVDRIPLHRYINLMNLHLCV